MCELHASERYYFEQQLMIYVSKKNPHCHNGKGRKKVTSPFSAKRKSRWKCILKEVCTCEYYIFNTEKTTVNMDLFPGEKKIMSLFMSSFPGDISIRYKEVPFIKLFKSGHYYTYLPAKMKPILNRTIYTNKYLWVYLAFEKNKTKPKQVYFRLFFLGSEKYILVSLSHISTAPSLRLISVGGIQCILPARLCVTAHLYILPGKKSSENEHEYLPFLQTTFTMTVICLYIQYEKNT